MSVVPIDISDPSLRRCILQPLARLRMYCRAYLLIDGLTRFVAVALLVAVAQFFLDRELRLLIDQRGALSLLASFILIGSAYRRIALPQFKPPSDAVLALALDRANPSLNDQLAAAVQFAAGKVGDSRTNSPELINAVIRDACQAAGGVSFNAVLNHRRALRGALELAGLVVATVVACAMMPEQIPTWFQRNWLLRDVPWAQRTTIAPVGYGSDGQRRIPRGDELYIEARNEGVVPKSVRLDWWTLDGRSGRETMARRVGDSRWNATLGPLGEDVLFRIVGGDERTREYRAVAVDLPRVERTTARIDPPAHTGMDPVTLDQQTVLELPVGSTLQIDAQFNKPLRVARFVGADGDAGECQQVSDRLVRVSWNAPKSGAYWFAAIDLDDWENRHPVRYTIKAIPDEPPTVRLELSNVGESITPQAELTVRLECADTYGLAIAELLIQLGDEPPHRVELEGFEPGRREFNIETRCDLGFLRAVPNDRVTVWAEASDYEPSGPNVTRSERIELRVLSPSDLLAELAGRELELRREFERIVSAQAALNAAVDRFLSDLPTETGPSTALTQRQSGLARRQNSHSRSCEGVGEGYREILGEMHTNKVAKAGEQRRIEERILAPLERLTQETMPSAASAISDLQPGADQSQIDAIPQTQADILRRMKSVLSNMLEWEGYREAVALLQEIIDEQERVRAATVEALEQELTDILDLDDIPESPQSPQNEQR